MIDSLHTVNNPNNMRRSWWVQGPRAHSWSSLQSFQSACKTREWVSAPSQSNHVALQVFPDGVLGLSEFCAVQCLEFGWLLCEALRTEAGNFRCKSPQWSVSDWPFNFYALRPVGWGRALMDIGENLPMGELLTTFAIGSPEFFFLMSLYCWWWDYKLLTLTTNVSKPLTLAIYP